MQTEILNVSRRRFLIGSSAFVLGTYAHGLHAKTVSQTASAAKSFSPNLFLTVSNNGVIEVTAHRSEMGQGVRTALAQIVADELDADWNDIVVNQAFGDSRYGDQNTDGSKSIRTFLEPLRLAGASGREMLKQAAATIWNVDVTDVSTHKSTVVHDSSGRKLAYSELVEAAATLDVPSNPPLKDRSDWQYIGKAIEHVDARDIATGSASFGADITLDNMAYAVFVHAPAIGQAAGTVNVPKAISENPAYIGYEVITPTPGAPLFNPVGGVAVLATDTYSAIRFSKSVEVEWQATNNHFNSEEHDERLTDIVAHSSTAIFESGTPEKVIAESDNVVEGVYQTPLLSHAPMEPPAAVADFGEEIRVWAPVQDPQSTQNQIAAAHGVDDLSKVKVMPTLLGGAFGRKSKPDFVHEAVELSKRRKRPVRVQWTREDDIRYDYFHASNAQYYAASLGEDGMPTSWIQRTAFPTIMSTFSPLANQPAPFELDMGFTRTPYRVKNQKFEAASAPAGVRIGWLRSVCNIFHAFGANVFVDELASAAEMDPIDYRMKMWPSEGIIDGVHPGAPAPQGHEFDIARLRHVLNRVRHLSDWDNARQHGRHLGVAVHHSFYSYVATVLEVSYPNNRLKVDNAYVVLDCGTYVNSDTCVAQMEGAVIFGLSLAMKSKINVEDGNVVQSNFDGYQVLRINEAPAIDVELIDSTAPPAGVGEPGVPPVAPALSNAVFAATGKRQRRLPLA